MKSKSNACIPLVAFITVLGIHLAHANERVADLEEYMDACVKVNEFNGSVLVSKDSLTVFSKGYGMANFEHLIANTPTTKFRIGSLTKQFTAMAVMVLEEQGKLNVQDPITKYLAETPKTWDGLKIHNLLTHTSGISDYTEMPEYGRDMMLPQSIDQMVARFRDEPLDFPPGEQFRYSNSGYFLLGAIIERASGMPYHEFVRKEVCNPLNLHDTGYDRFGTVLRLRAGGYQRQSNQISHAGYLDMSQPFAAGSLYSTVEDLSRWDQALGRRELISEKSYEKMFTPEKSNYAYGWSVRSDSGRKTISHFGEITGFRSQIIRYPDDKLCVVVLCNVQQSNPSMVAADLAAIMLGEEYEIPKVRQVAEVDPEIYDAYEGQYQIRRDLILTIKRVEDELTAQATGRPRRRLVPESESRFFNKVIDAQITFVQDEGGRTVALILNQGRREIRAERIDSPESE